MRGTGVLAATLLTACATVGVPEVQPGKSTAQDVEKQMGKPALELKRPDGGKVQYFPTYPFGRVTYAVTLGGDGVVRGMDQRLTENNLHSVKAGMKKEQVLELLGPPRQETPDAAQQATVLEYPWLTGNGRKRITWVYVGADGAVRNVKEREDFEAEPSE